MRSPRRLQGWPKFLSGQNGLVQATLILAGASLASRLLGLLRDRLFAGTFGAGNELDAYYAAFRLPDLVFNLMVLGALSAAFIPVFTEYLANKREREAWAIADSLITLATLIIAVTCALIFVFAHPLTQLLAPGFDHAKQDQVVHLTRIMLLSPILFGVSSIAGGILNAYNRFTAYALAPILYNLGIIFGVLVLTPRLGVNGLAWGVVIGAGLHFLIQFSALGPLGYRYHPSTAVTEAVRRIGRLTIPRATALGVLQINLLVETIIASTLAVGSVAVINLANNLQTVVSGIVGLSIATAVFPTLARFASVSDTDAFLASLTRAFRLTLYFTIPLSVLVIIERAQIVRVILGTGNFTWQDTLLTAQTLGLFAIGLAAASAAHLVNRGFYALQDTMNPLRASVVGAAVNLGFALLFTKVFDWGVMGLAAAWSVSTIVYLVILVVVLEEKLGSWQGREVVYSLGRILLASLIMAAATYGTLHVMAGMVDMQRTWGIVTQGVVGALVGGAVYLAISRLIGIEEAGMLLRWVRGRSARSAAE